MYNRPQVAPNVRRAVNVPTASEGATLAASALGTAADAFQKERERAGRIRVDAAEAEIRGIGSRLADEVSRMQRTQAFGAETMVAERWDTETAKVLSQIADPEVRAAVSARSNVLRSELQERARRHALNQREVVDKESFDINEAADMELVATLPPAEAEPVMVRIEQRRRARMTDLGVTPEVQEAALSAVRSETRTGQITRLLSERKVDEAEALMGRVRDQLRPADRQKMDAALAQAKQGMSINAMAAQVLAESQDPVVRNERIASIADPEMRKQVRNIVRDEEVAAKQAEDLRQEQSFERLERHVQGGGRLSDPSVATDVSNLSTSQRQTLERFTMAPTNDNAAWLDWYSKTPDEIAKMTESEFRSHWSRLSTSHRDDAERMRQASKNKTAGPDGVTGYVTPQDQIARAMRSVAGIAPFAPMTQASKEKQELAVQFQAQADVALRQERSAKGRPLTPDETQAALDRLRLSTFRSVQYEAPGMVGPMVVTPGRSREVVRPLFQIPDTAFARGLSEGTMQLTMDRIPAPEVQRIRNILTGNGLAGTDTQIERYYTQELFGGDVVAVLESLRRR
jgi:hypothetical protein